MPKSVIFSEPQIKALQAGTLSAFVLPIKHRIDEFTCFTNHGKMNETNSLFNKSVNHILTPQIGYLGEGNYGCTICGNGIDYNGDGIKSPYQVGQRIFVKEKWGIAWADMFQRLVFADDYALDIVDYTVWHSPVYLLEKNARYHLEITTVKAVRVQDMEAVQIERATGYSFDPGGWCTYILLKYGVSFWDNNGWLWYNEFKLVNNG